MLTQLAGVVLAAAEEHEELAPLIAPPFVIGGVMLAALLLLMFICVSFMNLGHRHEAVAHTTEDPHRQHTNKHLHGDDSASSNH